MKYVDYVNVRQGTNSVPSFSSGNILPITAMPFGMTSFAVETRGKTHTLFYNPNDCITTGIRLTHCPSPWINDYGNFSMMPQTGEKIELSDGRKSGFRQNSTVMTPYYINLKLLLYRAHFELVPTERGAAGRLSFEEDDVVQRFSLCNAPQEVCLELDTENRRLTGYTKANTGSVPDNYAEYFVFEFDRDIDLQKSAVRGANNEQLDITKVNIGNGLDITVAFVNDGKKVVNFKLATSFISLEQAQVNLNRELENKSLEQLRSEARNAWEANLSKIEIETEDAEQARTFYTCLYRMLLFPRMFYEFNSDNRMIHYSPANGEIHDGPMYTDNGFWDTYKTVYPLFSIILSERYREMCDAFLNFYKEAGWLPRWLSPGAVDCMPGTAIDAVFADAAAKGVVTDKEKIALMIEAMKKHANVTSLAGIYGREGVADYLKYHYVTAGHRESVNKTLDYSYGDFCIAVLAKALGDTKTYDEYIERAMYYQNIFDKETGFMRAKNENGDMRSDWSQFDWGGDYCEGGPWQNSWAVYQDLYGLAQLLGGTDAMKEKMDTLFATPPYYKPYGYQFEIHEMTEMAAVDFGQCALSNQPSFHIPYIYAAMGYPDLTAYWVRRAARKLFNSGVNGYPGDEDNGSAAGWYVFSTMGFYPVCPSVDQYVLGSPCVKRCVIHTDSGNDFVMEAPKNDRNNVYFRKVLLNGSESDKLYIEQDFIKNGGTLEFDMTSHAQGNVYTDASLPYSISNQNIK